MSRRRHHLFRRFFPNLPLERLKPCLTVVAGRGRSLTNTGDWNNAVTISEDVPLALDTPLGAGLVSNHPPMVEDALMMALDEDDAKGDDAGRECLCRT